MDYYYKQSYPEYAYYGLASPTMADAGCVVTALAMLYSYFIDKAYTPERMLLWGKHFGMIDASGRTNFEKFCEATGNLLRMSTNPNDAKPGEKVYGIREVKLKNSKLHWVVDHPEIHDTIIDPLDGQSKPFNSQNYTGRAYFYIGKK